MKSIKLIALGTLLSAGVFSAVVYSSCSKDACKGVTCQNGGTCSGGNCVCPTGYTGANCQTLAILGTWSGSDVCTPSGTYNVTLTLANSSVDSTKVLITNPGGFGTSVVITGTISSDGKTVTYTNQTTGAVTLSGTMTLSDNTHFAHSYTAKDTTSTVSCSGNYTKQ